MYSGGTPKAWASAFWSPSVMYLIKASGFDCTISASCGLEAASCCRTASAISGCCCKISRNEPIKSPSCCWSTSCPWDPAAAAASNRLSGLGLALVSSAAGWSSVCDSPLCTAAGCSAVLWGIPESKYSTALSGLLKAAVRACST
ncbi:hypothetical protein OGATHE_003767 [Ogataea polymorpha]|uniref:Uncharacterized protein n=1 Tax=Ogataea polymorpha TaxID=460523 RepID=A0A9P8P4A5_9ASCO|nr:hypothetical protein OGATHE_003767 [Ogataea polymorpha]